MVLHHGKLPGVLYNNLHNNLQVLLQLTAQLTDKQSSSIFWGYTTKYKVAYPWLIVTLQLAQTSPERAGSLYYL